MTSNSSIWKRAPHCVLFALQASLIQFLIENCLKIFGEDITSLLGENSKSCHNNEKAAGTVNSLIGLGRHGQQGSQGSWQILSPVLEPRASPGQWFPAAPSSEDWLAGQGRFHTVGDPRKHRNFQMFLAVLGDSMVWYSVWEFFLTQF